MTIEPYLGEIRMMSFAYPPPGWAMCDGQLLPISQNQALFSILGTTYGGNGTTHFALPDLRGRAAAHWGNGFELGERGGEETHVLTPNEMPQHTHAVLATNDPAVDDNPTMHVLGQAPSNLFTAFNNALPMAVDMIDNAGGNQGHENMQPFLVVSFCIALRGQPPDHG